MKQMKKVDGKGLLCPQPLILTRRALKESSEGETIQIECDNKVAFQNILTYLRDQSLSPDGIEQSGVFTINVINQPDKEAEDITCQPGRGQTDLGYAVVISSDKMGEGDPQLGAILMKGFLNALNEQPILPTNLIFYNSGVKFVVPDSGVLSSLKILEESGVEISSCGTCLDFFGLKEQLAVGSISNMFTITEIMVRTGHVVKP